MISLSIIKHFYHISIDNKTFFIISLSKQSKINIYINQKDSLPTMFDGDV